MQTAMYVCVYVSVCSVYMEPTIFVSTFGLSVARLFECVCVCVCVCMCVCVCVCVCVCIVCDAVHVSASGFGLTVVCVYPCFISV